VRRLREKVGRDRILTRKGQDTCSPGRPREVPAAPAPGGAGRERPRAAAAPHRGRVEQRSAVSSGSTRCPPGPRRRGATRRRPVRPRGRPGLPEVALAPVYRQPLSGHYYLVVDASGASQQSRSLWDHRIPLDPLAPGERRVLEIEGPRGSRFLVLRRRLPQAGTDAHDRRGGGRGADRARTSAVTPHGPRDARPRRSRRAPPGAGGLRATGVPLARRAARGRGRVESGEASGLREDVPDEVRPRPRGQPAADAARPTPAALPQTPSAIWRTP